LVKTFGIPLDPELTLHVAIDDATDPWEDAEPVMLVHGLAESGEVWYAWVPHLARRHRVLRPDLRGFGRSSVPEDPCSFPWSPAAFADDLARLLDALEIPAIHLVGARLGAPVSIMLAAHHPERVRTLSLVSGLVRGSDVQPLNGMPISAAPDLIESEGVEAWAAPTQRARLGSAASDGCLDWWTERMARSDAAVCAAVLRAAGGMDLGDALADVRAPTFVLAAEASAVQSIEATRAWQRQIAGSRLRVLDGDSPHLAAVAPDRCARLVSAFIARHQEERTK
jgi:pimeloyl-ACP methyl ester carboxylesterase